MRCDHRRAGTVEWIHLHISWATKIADRPLNQFHRLHGRVQIVLVRFFDVPNVALFMFFSDHPQGEYEEVPNTQAFRRVRCG